MQRLAEHDVVPRLAVLLVGDDPASHIYVQNKVKSCKKVGIRSQKIILPDETPAHEVYDKLRELSDDPEVDGVLLQLPLPPQIDPLTAIERIAPDRDVDGFHPRNLGMLMAWRGELEPCTPRGIMTLLRAYGVDPSGKSAVVVGRSLGVGRPMAQMLVRADATVTVCHRHTVELRQRVADAEILIVATGVAELVKGEWVRPGATVVDVGITRREDGTLVGDVEYEAARERAAFITPVPGGVGPMTVATLLENTVRAACARRGIDIDNRKLREENHA